MEPEVMTTDSARETEALGRRLASRLTGGDCILLVGELAAGKTTLVRGLTAGLGSAPEAVDSPTYVLVQTYVLPPDRPIRRLHHVDLYRLHRSAELDEIGLEELLSEPDAVTAIEWPKALLDHRLPPATPVWTVTFELLDGDRRRIAVTPPQDRDVS